MKVLLVHNRYRRAQPSGENVSFDVEAQLLAEHGCEVFRLELESDEIVEWPLRKKLGLPFRVVWSREGSRLTREAIVESGVQLVHFHNTFPLFSPAVLWQARRMGVLVVQSLRNFRPLCPSGDFLRDGTICEDCLGRLPLPAVIHGCYRDSHLASVPIAAMDAFHRSIGTWSACVDAFITPSEFTRGKYIEAGWSPDKLFVKYNTVVRREAPDEGCRKGFVCVSRLSDEKGVDVLLEAWQDAFPDGSEGLSIIGSGPAQDRLASYAATIPGVAFLGQIPRHDVVELLSRTRAAVIPSLCYETFSRVVAEAFSVGTPVIASRVGALAEVVTDGEDGLLTEPGSKTDLARALRVLETSSERVCTFGQQARATFEAKFAPEVTTARLLSLYRDAAERRPKKPPTTRTSFPPKIDRQ